MSVFDQREEGFERLHALSEELRFKALARRDKLIGLWAAEARGLAGEAAQDYAKALVQRRLGDADPETLARELEAALASVTPSVSAHRIRRKIEEATARAMQDIAAGR